MQCSYTGSVLGKEEDARRFVSQDIIGDAAYEAAVAATVICKTFAERLEMYRVAADAGHTEARVRYATKVTPTDTRGMAVTYSNKCTSRQFFHTGIVKS